MDSQTDKPLSNADFRRLLQAPRSNAMSSDDQDSKPLDASVSSAGHSFTHHKVPSVSRRGTEPRKVINQTEESANAKKAVVVARPKEKTEEGELLDILKKYRDRAKERRDGELQESQNEIDLIQASGYRAVAPDAKLNLDLAEKRKKQIEESKYLGGDMEHTHLVKGLDYALLQKVRSEILSKEREDDDLEKAYQARKHERDEVESQLKSVLARNIYNALFKNDDAKKTVNELFAPRRMAYVMELDDEFSIESEIPTTLIRSKQDCPVDETTTNLSINDVVIQKLTQVLSYLRADTKKKKKAGKMIPEEERVKVAGQNIYEDVGEYVPNIIKSHAVKSDNHSSKFPREQSRKYFDNPSTTQGSSEIRTKHNERYSRDTSKASGTKGELNVKANNNLSSKEEVPAVSSSNKANLGMDSYAECYPGGFECYDAAGDSDDDTDFSKMDMGNKKGPIRRWDFDTEQEYEEYMSRREALPKAAFQYGVKMLDGRKTRKLPGTKGDRDDKAKLDKQWAQISKIISKRKEDGSEDPSSKRTKIY